MDPCEGTFTVAVLSAVTLLVPTFSTAMISNGRFPEEAVAVNSPETNAVAVEGSTSTFAPENAYNASAETMTTARAMSMVINGMRRRRPPESSDGRGGSGEGEASNDIGAGRRDGGMMSFRVFRIENSVYLPATVFGM